MARTPKPAPIPVPTPRGRNAKAGVTPPGPAIGEGSGAKAVAGETAERPVRGGQGRLPKRRAGTAISSVFQSDAGQQPVADVDPLEAAAGPAPAEDSDAPSGADKPDGDAVPPAPGLDAAPPARPAAQWDQATDTVRFHWAEIERTASQDGPNRAMAKLLVAARAEGANSRWPL